MTVSSSTAALAAFALGLLVIAGAWGSQLLGGLMPCELCLEQRLPYYWGLPLVALALVAGPRLPRWAGVAILVAALGIFAWGAWLAGYHSGVEWGFWPGPTACTGTGVEMNFSDLSNINATRVVPCDKVQFRFLGISLAGYNFLASLAVMALLATAATLRWKGR